MNRFDFDLKTLEPLAAETMLAALRNPLSFAAANPFLASFAAALDHAINRKIDEDEPAPKYNAQLETLTAHQLGEVIGTFNVFYLTFKTLRYENAVKFCEQVREIASAEMLARISRQNPPGRFFPETN
jgi:hypothetical protein